MVGKVGQVAKNWQSKKHYIEIKEAYYRCGGNIKQAAESIGMTPQQAFVILKKFYKLDGRGHLSRALKDDVRLKKTYLETGNLSEAARQIGISRSKALRIKKKFWSSILEE